MSESIISEIRTKISQEDDVEVVKKNHEDNGNDEIKNETSVWLNSAINWLFINLSDSPQIQQSLQQIIMEILVDLRRSSMGLILRNSELISVEVGGSCPRIYNTKIITGSSLKDPTSAFPLTLQFDLEYEGFSRLLLSFDTIFFNYKIETETILKTFKATICLVIQDRAIHYCFLKEPSIIQTNNKVFFTPSSNSYKSSSRLTIPLINYLLSGSLIKKVLGSVIGPSFPRFLSQWYRAGPEQPPYPWHPSVLQNPELLYTWTQK